MNRSTKKKIAEMQVNDFSNVINERFVNFFGNRLIVFFSAFYSEHKYLTIFFASRLSFIDLIYAQLKIFYCCCFWSFYDLLKSQHTPKVVSVSG